MISSSDVHSTREDEIETHMLVKLFRCADCAYGTRTRTRTGKLIIGPYLKVKKKQPT